MRDFKESKMAASAYLVGFLTFFATVNCQFRFDYSYNAKVGGWLKLHEIPANFLDAFKICDAEGAVLASPLNPQMKNAMLSLYKKSMGENCPLYTGIHSTVTKGAYASVEGIPISKISVQWAPNEPDNYNDKEDCIVMFKSGTMADINCKETFPFICYKKRTRNMAINECGTIDNAYQLDTRTGSCYKFHNIGRSWNIAYMVCMAEGGHLAIINSETEAQVIKEIFAKYPPDKLFSKHKVGASLGFHDWGERGVWHTVHVNCQFRYDYTFNAEVGGWLKIHEVPANFLDAFKKCDAEGTLLASPLNVQMKNAMLSLHKQSKNKNFALYTGIHSTVTKGAYSSVEGELLKKISIEWAPNEPDNFNDTESCIIMVQSGSMADVPCTETFPFICYKKKTRNITLNECGTTDNGYQLDTRTGSCYKFHNIGRTWKQAYMVCMAEGGYLAIINSETEAQVIRDLFAKYPKEKIFSPHKDGASLGFHDWGEKGVFHTVHGQKLEETGYSKFAEGQPDDNKAFAGGSSCGATFRDGLLDDIWCSETNIAFICEMKPDSLIPLVPTN